MRKGRGCTGRQVSIIATMWRWSALLLFLGRGVARESHSVFLGCLLQGCPILNEFKHRFTAVFGAFQNTVNARQQQFVSQLWVVVKGENVAGTQAHFGRPAVLRSLHPQQTVLIDKWRGGLIEVFEKAIQVSAVMDNVFTYVLNNHGVKGLAVFLPLLRSTDDARALLRRKSRTLVLRGNFLDPRTPFEFSHWIESSCEQVRPCRDGYCVIRENNHRDKEFFGVVQLLGSRANFAASLDRAWYLGKVQHTKIGFRVAKPIVCERTRDG